jgi:photosystem II stability/assembly factor-like uncharacterized protein
MEVSMKSALLYNSVAVLAMLFTASSASAQIVSWASLNGPTYAVEVQDIAVGYQGGQTILYIADGPDDDSVLESEEMQFRPFKSTDGGTTWMPLNLSTPRAIACVRDNPDIVYAGANDGSTTQGIYKSTDGGLTWVQKNNGLTHFTVRRIAISPHDPNVVYAGMFLLNLGGGGTGWLFRTVNGGGSWTVVEPFHQIDLSVSAIVFDPTDPDRIWVSGFNVNSDANNGVWRSDDGGNTWGRKVNGMIELRIGGLDADALNSEILYCATFSGPNARVYKSTNAGDSWAVQFSASSTVSFRGVKSDPFSSSYVYAVADGGNAVRRAFLLIACWVEVACLNPVIQSI